MIFFGTKGKVIAGEQMLGTQCPDCGNSQFTSFGILRYFHLYWIPVFPTSKKIGMECANCKQTLMDNDVPAHLADQIRSGVFTAGRMLPMFSGLIILAIAGLWLNDLHQQDVAEEESYLAQPAVNDYYIVDLSQIFTESDPDYPWGLLRIKSVNSSDIEMQIGNVVYNKATGFSADIREGAAAANSYYDAGTISFEIEELQMYQDTGAIYSIERE